jgi:hypothetical protein
MPRVLPFGEPFGEGLGESPGEGLGDAWGLCFLESGVRSLAWGGRKRTKTRTALVSALSIVSARSRSLCEAIINIEDCVD